MQNNHLLRKFEIPKNCDFYKYGKNLSSRGLQGGFKDGCYRMADVKKHLQPDGSKNNRVGIKIYTSEKTVGLFRNSIFSLGP